MATVTDITSWFQKNSSWIKTVAILLLIGFLILAFTNAGCARKQRDKFISETTILHLLNDSLAARNKILQDSLIVSDTEKNQYIHSLLVFSTKNDSLVTINKRLRTHIDSIPLEIAKLTSDSIYKFLTTIAYPDTGKTIYPFNKDQIRHIDETYFQKIAFADLVIILDKEINNSTLQLLTMDSLVTSYRESTVIITKQNSNLTETISNKNKEIELYKKQEKQGNVDKIIWQVSTAVATIIALVFAFK